MFGVATLFQAIVASDSARARVVALDALDSHTRYGVDGEKSRRALRELQETLTTQVVYASVESALKGIGA